MHYWGIQKRIVLMTLLPCLMTIALMSGYFAWQQQTTTSLQAQAHAIETGRQLAITIQNAQRPIPREYLEPYLDLEDIRSIAVLNLDQTPLLRVGPNMYPISGPRIIQGELHRFQTGKSQRLRFPLYNVDKEQPIQKQITGWIEIEYGYSQVALLQNKQLFQTILLVLLFGALALFLTWRFSRRITQPLGNVAKTLEHLESGNLDARVKLSRQAEFNELAGSINTMAASLQRAQTELQENIEQATDDLKQTLDELEVQNIELNLARREALDASQTKSDFLANMSHEIRTPLNGILGFTRLLSGTRLNKRQLEYLQTIESSSTSLLSIINDILDFSKIEAGKLVLDQAPVNVSDIIDDVITMLAPEAHKKHIELAALVYQDVPQEIMGDSLRLKQILTNLINNAIKFTHTGSVIVRVMLEEQEGSDVTLKFSVQDTGIGMTDDQQKNLFKAFSQGDESTSRRYGGTGLGLVISRYLVEHMQGELGFDSTAHVGSEFFFSATFEVCENEDNSWKDAPWYGLSAGIFHSQIASSQSLQGLVQRLGIHTKRYQHLPAMLQNQTITNHDILFIEITEDSSYDMIESLSKKSNVIALVPNNESRNLKLIEQLGLDSLVLPVAFRNISKLMLEMFLDEQHAPVNQQEETARPVRVLAVDDNQPNLELVTTWLKQLDVQVVAARGGLEAVELATEQNFDLIFMDIQMPDLDGVQATQRIRQNNPDKKCAVVALTAHALPNERKKLMKKGFDDYLTKPLDEQQLEHTLKKWTHHQVKFIERASHDVIPQETNPILDWHMSLKLAGGNSELAENMLNGLVSEIHTLKPMLEQAQAEALIEPIHKLHGLCRYVGAQELQQALQYAETQLKTEPQYWQDGKDNLLRAIEDFLIATQTFNAHHYTS
ncbi:response regulator [Bermanella marisrubri]|uniref:histidine kinase n=1 Tax=Bermanella marisrubri TaxID=207949 RepID=Q1MXP3_9GAMM|nr:response regulator [Bermanella marisrubri]EAT10741.1 Multi-sensor Hybrid Histidine Kinase [Oceanobacter sp. RED65] [Bermanella marisrubri]QIZ83602.1 response regulator [Bermanella marisrubri]